jgi:N-carbamoylputrescine amidase
MNTIRIAGFQVRSLTNDPVNNLRNAEKYVLKAVQQGAKLVLGPELLTPGYIFHSSLWKSAEPPNGPTYQWLRRLSLQHSIYLGAGYLETDGKDFYDTFVLMNPDGSEAGRVRKAYAPNWESFYYKEHKSSHVIQTPLGKLGVGICFENYFSSFITSHHNDKIDLMLMPCCAASNDPPIGLFFWNLRIREIGPHYARTLRVPTIMVNKIGAFMTPIPLLPFANISMRFDGSSNICDGHGTILAQLDHEEDIVIADVALKSGQQRAERVVAHGSFAMPTSIVHRLVYAPLNILRAFGRMLYRVSLRRRVAARSTFRSSQNDHK